MKFTKQYLIRIIKEEIESVLLEEPDGPLRMSDEFYTDIEDEPERSKQWRAKMKARGKLAAARIEKEKREKKAALEKYRAQAQSQAEKDLEGTVWNLPEEPNLFWTLEFHSGNKISQRMRFGPRRRRRMNREYVFKASAPGTLQLFNSSPDFKGDPSRPSALIKYTDKEVKFIASASISSADPDQIFSFKRAPSRPKKNY